MQSSARETSEVQSPALTKLAQAIQENPAALAEFWRELEETGTPIFEDYDEESNSWLVTFVFRDTDKLDNVLLNEFIQAVDFPEKRMEKLPGTDVWHKSMRILDGVRSQYGFAPNDSLVPKFEEKDWDARRSTWIPDPLNQTQLLPAGLPRTEATQGHDVSVLSLPGAPAQKWIEQREGISRGDVQQHQFRSELLENERNVWTYVHPEVDRTGTVPLLVQFDGEAFQAVLCTPTVLDNLTADGRIAPMAAVFVGNVDRGEELPCNADFVQMLKTELLPFVKRELGIEIAGNQTVVNGVSYGGLASMFAGLTEPETFGLVASQSGSFWWKPNPMDSNKTLGGTSEYNWLERQILEWDTSDIRIWMEAGTLEGSTSRDGIPSLLDSNRHMRNVLRARGYDVEYREFFGGHDFAHWRDAQAEALIYLLGK